MTRIDIKGTIYDKLSDPIERCKYRIIHDSKQTGGKELSYTEYINNYINQKFCDGPRYSHIYVTMIIDYENDVWVSRFISFDSEIHRLIWLADHNDHSLHSLNPYAGVILN